MGKYYQGNEVEQRFARTFSFSDRVRYYWPDKKIQNAQEILFSNIEKSKIPFPLLSQYMPQQFDALRKGLITDSPKELVLDRIRHVLRSYAQASKQRVAVKGDL